MATVRKQQRYISAINRNVSNFLSRFRGVNIGNAETRGRALGRMVDVKFDLNSLKFILGVRVNDLTFDSELNEALAQGKAAMAKSAKNDSKKTGLKEKGEETVSSPAKKKSLQKGLEKIKGKLKLSKTEQEMVEFATGA